MGKPFEEFKYDLFSYLNEDFNQTDQDLQLPDDFIEDMKEKPSTKHPGLEKLIENCLEGIEEERHAAEDEIRMQIARVNKLREQGVPYPLQEAAQLVLGDLRAKYQNMYGNLPNDIR